MSTPLHSAVAVVVFAKVAGIGGRYIVEGVIVIVVVVVIGTIGPCLE